MLNETLASLYEELKAYTRGTDISTPQLVLVEITIRYAMENRIGLELDKNFDLYIQMARNLENPYHLYDKDEITDFFTAIDDDYEKKQGYPRMWNAISPVIFHMYDKKANDRFRETLSTKSFRKTYADFLKLDFKDPEVMDSLLYTLSHQARKDWRDEMSYSVGTLITKALSLNKESLVRNEISRTDLMLSALAISSDARTVAASESPISSLLYPLSRRIGKIEDGEKNTLLITDKLDGDLDEMFKESEKILYMAPSALLLSSSKENLEKREELIKSGRIEAVVVLPPLSVAGSENLSFIVLTDEEHDRILFADLNSKLKDRDYIRENQLTDKAIDTVTRLCQDGEVTLGITAMVPYEEVEEKMILVPMNYLSSRHEEEHDTEELEKKIDSLYEKLAALIAL